MGKFVRFYSERILKGGESTSQIHVLSANFVKFGRQEVGKIVRYLLDKKNKILPRCLFCSDRAQNLPGPVAANVLRVRMP